MKKVQLLFLLFLISNSLFAIEKSGCTEGKIKYLDRSSEIVSVESYCYDSLVRSISSMKKCSNNQECKSNLPGPFEFKLRAIQSPMGSPGFKICEKLNGVPQFIEYWDKFSWIKTSRCIFNDGSFIDIGALMLRVKYVE